MDSLYYLFRKSKLFPNKNLLLEAKDQSHLACINQTDKCKEQAEKHKSNTSEQQMWQARGKYGCRSFSNRPSKQKAFLCTWK